MANPERNGSGLVYTNKKGGRSLKRVDHRCVRAADPPSSLTVNEKILGEEMGVGNPQADTDQDQPAKHFHALAKLLPQGCSRQQPKER